MWIKPMYLHRWGSHGIGSTFVAQYSYVLWTLCIDVVLFFSFQIILTQHKRGSNVRFVDLYDRWMAYNFCFIPQFVSILMNSYTAYKPCTRLSTHIHPYRCLHPPSTIQRLHNPRFPMCTTTANKKNERVSVIHIFMALFCE